MQKEDIIATLQQKHGDLITWAQAHPDEKWILGPDGKWTTGQHIVHLIQSVKALNRAMSFPKFLLKYKFGISNRSSRSYEVVVQKYQDKLASVGNVVSPFSKNLPLPKVSEKSMYLNRLEDQYKQLAKKVSGWNEKSLDRYIVPHPLLGRMPFREITMWTGYHAEHHHKILKEKY